MALTICTAAFAASVMHLLPSAQARVPTGPFLDVKDCLGGIECPKQIDENSLYPRVAQAFEEFSKQNSSYYDYYWAGVKKDPEYLRFRKDDPRDKSLFISAAYEHGDALNPEWVAPLVQELGMEFDIKFVEARSVEDVCRYIKEAGELSKGSAFGKLKNVIIEAHGNSQKIGISSPDEKGSLNEKTDFEKCFKGLDPSGKIFLISTSAGGDTEKDQKNSIAQKIATIAKREVIAPIGLAYPQRLQISRSDGLKIFHPSSDSLHQNLFKLFRPRYETCQKVAENSLHPREKLATQVIKENLQSKGLLSKTAGFDETQEYTRLCSEDPKKKLLFLSAEEDWNDALNPKYNAEFLATLADYYDIKIKHVAKYSEVCEEIKKSSQDKNLEYVILNAHGSPQGMSLSAPDINNENLISIYNNNLGNCFSGVNKTGKIIFISCKTGAPGPNGRKDNIAGLVSEVAKKTVVAPNEIVYNGLTTITQKEPLEVFHSNKQAFFESFYRNPHNVYQEFNSNNNKKD